MAVGKRLRFEVFKRDAFTCQYCGRTPPAVTLQCDHVNAVSTGGTDDIDNLVTACCDCNQGKSNVPLGCIPSSLAEKVEALQERQEQLAAYNEMLESAVKSQRRQCNHIGRHFKKLFPGTVLGERFKKYSLPKFLKHFSYLELEEFFSLAASKFPRDPERAVKYFCGICWAKIKAGETNG